MTQESCVSDSHEMSSGRFILDNKQLEGSQYDQYVHSHGIMEMIRNNVDPFVT